MSTPRLHFAVANGFPLETYTPLLAQLGETFTVEHYAPRPLIPNQLPDVLDSWEQFADDLIEALRRAGGDPVLGVGHSFGGVISVIAAAKAPELFTGLVLLDATFLDEGALRAFEGMRAVGEGDRFFLVKQALNRRATFESLESAFDYWRPKPLFTDWSDEALWYYIRAALVEADEGFVLRWSPEWEARIFATIPVDEWDWLSRVPTALPVLVLRGLQSDTLLADPAARLCDALHADYAEIEGGHLFPMSAPDRTANAVLEWWAGNSVAKVIAGG